MAEQLQAKARAIANQLASQSLEQQEATVARLSNDDPQLAALVSALVVATRIGGESSEPDVLEYKFATESPKPATDPFQTLDAPVPQADPEQLTRLLSENLSRFDSQLLRSDELSALNTVRERFEQQWQAGTDPEIGDFIPEHFSEPARHRLVRELVAAELSHRQRSGKSLVPSEYLQRLPKYRFSIESAWWAWLHELTRSRPPERNSANNVAMMVAGRWRTPETNELRFRPVRLHAQGGLGAVFRANDTQLSRTVALKEIRRERGDDPDSRLRFLFEAKITGQLEHPGIVPVYAMGRYSDGRPYYAMRFVTGDTLGRTIHRFHKQHPQPSRDTFYSQEFRALVRRLIDACNAIHYAHDQGVLHRDIKPDNVMLGAYGETLVVDWGLAKRLGSDNKKTVENGNRDSQLQLEPLSTTDPVSGDSIKGTLVFMSPEQAAGKNDQLTAATDVYSLGAVLFNMLTNDYSVAGKTHIETLNNVRSGKLRDALELMPTAPRPLVSVCRRAMAFDPSVRFESAVALADDLERWLSDERVHAHSDTELIAERAGRLFRRYRSWTFSGIVALALITVVSVVASLLIASAKRRETAAKNQAIEYYGIAGDSIDDWLVHSSDALKYLSGAGPIRRRLLEMATEDYQRLADLQSSDPDISLTRGKVMLRLGDIARRERDSALARTHYNQAAEIFDSSNTANYRIERANAEIRLGQCELLDENLETALMRFTAAERILDGVNGGDGHTSALEYCSVAQLNRGAVHYELGQLDDAEASLQQGIDGLVRLANEHGEVSAEARWKLAVGRSYLASIGAARNRFDESPLRLAEEDLRQLRESFPDQPRYLKSLADTQLAYVEYLTRWGDVNGQVGYSLNAVENFDALSRAIPDEISYRAGLVAARTQLAIALRENDRTAEAARIHNETAALVDGAIDAIVEVLPFQLVTGQLLTDLGLHRDACDRFQASIASYRDLLVRDPDRREYREQLSLALTHFAFALEQDGQLPSANEALSEAAEELRRLSEAFPDVPRYQEIAARVQERLGRLHRSIGAAKVASDYFESALAAWEAIPRVKLTPRQRHDYAWMLATHPDPDFRAQHGERARLLAETAEAAVSDQPRFMATHAITRCQVDPEGALAIVDRIEASRGHLVGRDLLIKAMALAERGNATESREAFESGKAWIERSQPDGYEARTLLELAEQVLGAAGIPL